MNRKRLSAASLTGLMLALALQGCTTEARYDGFKRAAESRCQNQPPGERERCLEELNRQSYSAYQMEREREKAGNGQKP